MKNTLQEIEKSLQKKNLDPKIRESLLQKKKILLNYKTVRK